MLGVHISPSCALSSSAAEAAAAASLLSQPPTSLSAHLGRMPAFPKRPRFQAAGAGPSCRGRAGALFLRCGVAGRVGATAQSLAFLCL